MNLVSLFVILNQNGNAEVKSRCYCQNEIKLQKWILEVRSERKRNDEIKIQKWIFKSKLNALRDEELKNLTKRWELSRNELIWINSLKDICLESKLQKFNPRLVFTSLIWHNSSTYDSCIYYVKMIHCVRILNSTQIENRDSWQTIKESIVHKENNKLLRIRKLKKNSRSKLSKAVRTFR